jgi:polyisoprenoid-binding protein YceI
MIKLFISLIFAATAIFATQLNLQNSCSYSQEGNMVVNFEAYKTPDKIGVKGVFESVDFKPAKLSGDELEDIFVGSSVLIDTKSVNSNNEKRDAKLMKFFFGNLKSEYIKGKITKMQHDKALNGKSKSGVFIVNITMNGVSKDVPMKYTYANDVVTAIGTMDILDFNGNKALSSINEACYDLHKGKTWSDVTIGFSTKVKFELCYVKK